MLSAVRKNLELGSSTLIQERITGTEYIVNTVSHNGYHRLTSMWVYEKMRLDNGTNAYISVMTVSELGPGHSELVSYAYDVLDAIGIKYGAVHGEYMIDEKGPVLIEVNCRPMGSGMTRKYIEGIFGHHKTDVALESYIDPEKFAQDRMKPYRLRKFGGIKIFVVPNDTAEESSPVIQLTKHLRSYYAADFTGAGQREGLVKTRNYETSGGTIHLLHEDENIVRDDSRILHKAEMRFPSLLFQDKTQDSPKPSENPGIIEVMRDSVCYGSTLIFSDVTCEAEGAYVVDSESLKSAYDSYNQGILWLVNIPTPKGGGFQ